MIANLFATILVIAIHYNSKSHIDVSNGYSWNYLTQEFLTNGIGRVSVPFFALISGFFLAEYVSSLDNYINTLQKKVKTLLIPYVLGSLLVFITSSILKHVLWSDGLPNLEPYMLLRTILARPVSVQFWFLRDLIILTIISPVILNSHQILNLLMGCILTVLWITDIQPFPIITDWYLINIETLFYFWLGGQLYRFKSSLYDLIESRLVLRIIIFWTWIVLVCIRIAIDPDVDVWYVRNYTALSLLLYKLSIIVGIISLIQISELFKQNKALIYLSGLTTFVYLFHLVPLSYFRIAVSRFVSNDFVFYFSFPIATLLAFLLACGVSNYWGSVYAVLTGGRDPRKALERMQISNADL